MVIKSLRWRLQAWHALVLTSVLAVYGLVVYVLGWQSRLQQIDAELDRTAEVIMSRVRRLFPWPQPFRMPNSGPSRWSPPPRSEKEFANRSGSGSQKLEEPNSRSGREASRRDQTANSIPAPRVESDIGPVSALAAISASRESREPTRPRGQSMSRDPFRPRETSAGSRDQTSGREPAGPREITAIRVPSPGDWPEPSLGLPEDFLQLFEGDEDSRLYFVVWDRDGKVLQKSASAIDVPFPGVRVGEDRLPVRVVRLRGAHREVVHASSFDSNVLVGRSIVNDVTAQQRSGALRLIVGLAVLAAGLVGGWWSSSRAIRPIIAMTATAESISAKRLSARIDLSETDNELGQLATVLNRTFDRLQASFEQQVRFTADASHELRTPLSVVLMHTELALSRQRSPEEYRTTLETCRAASQRMKSLIDGLLTLARFDSDAAALEFEPVDLAGISRECLELIRPLADERRLTLSGVTLPTFVRGDRQRLSQVLTNLLSNAIRYNREGGCVRVNIHAENGEAVMAITDTGVGIASEDLPHIFDRFYRVDTARSRSDGGSGLGLSICKTIVEAHSGTIVAQSQPGQGTTVTVRFPLCQPDADDAEVAAIQ